MSRSVVRASYLIFYQIIFRFLLTLYKQCNHSVDTLILRFFFLCFLLLVSCTLFVHATCNFHINLRHISAVVVFFIFYFFVPCFIWFFSNWFCTFFGFFLFPLLSFLMWNSSRYFIELGLYSLRSNCLNITILNEYDK